MAERRMPTEADYPSNSIGNKIDKVDAVEPVHLKGRAKAKRSIAKEMRKEFISEDAPTIGDYLIFDILFPAMKDMILDIGHGAIDAAFGDRDRRGGSYYSRSRRPSGGSYISYNRYYDDRDRRRRDRDDDRYEVRRRNRDLDDIIFDYREDADDVLDRMLDYLERYDDVPVSYLYDICGMTVPGDFTKDDWGWTDLSGARVRKVRGGYILDLPRVRPI